VFGSIADGGVKLGLGEPGRRVFWRKSPNRWIVKAAAEVAQVVEGSIVSSSSSNSKGQSVIKLEIAWIETDTCFFRN